MVLESAIRDVLRSTSKALTFDEVVAGVMQRLEPGIRKTLNDLTNKNQIKRHVGGRDHPWRYQGVPVVRRI